MLVGHYLRVSVKRRLKHSLNLEITISGLSHLLYDKISNGDGIISTYPKSPFSFSKLHGREDLKKKKTLFFHEFCYIDEFMYLQQYSK